MGLRILCRANRCVIDALQLIAWPPSAKVLSFIYHIVAISPWIVSASSAAGCSTDALNRTGASSSMLLIVAIYMVRPSSVFR
jgi:hypothetical protein